MDNFSLPTQQGGPSAKPVDSSPYLSRMIPRRNPSAAASWQSNYPRPGDGVMSPLLPENAWLLDMYRKEFPNVPDDVLMEILRKKFANGGPQMANPSMPSAMPTNPKMKQLGGRPMGIDFQLQGLGL